MMTQEEMTAAVTELPMPYQYDQWMCYWHEPQIQEVAEEVSRISWLDKEPTVKQKAAITVLARRVLDFGR
jgi:hypothetical protein